MTAAHESIEDDMVHGNPASGERDRSLELFNLRRRDMMRHFRNSKRVQGMSPSERRREWAGLEPQLLAFMKDSPHVRRFTKSFGDKPLESAPSVIVGMLLDETVVTNDRVLNHALKQAGNIIGRRDISPLDKFEMLAQYVLKSRREILGKPEE